MKNKKHMENKKIHWMRNAVILLVLFSIICFFEYRSLQMYQNTAVAQYMNLDETAGYNVEGTTYTPVDGQEHVLKYSVPEQTTRSVSVYFNSPVGVDLPVKMSYYYGGALVKEINTTIPAADAYCTVLNENLAADQVWISIEGSFDLASATSECIYVRDDGVYGRYVRILFVMWLVLMVVLGCAARLAVIENFINKFMDKCCNLWKAFKAGQKEYLRNGVLLLLGILLGNVIWMLLRKPCLGNAWSVTTGNILFGSMIGLAGGVLLFYGIRKKLHFETVYLVCTLVMGTVLAAILPLHLNVSWDDQIHFQTVAALSHPESSQISLSEQAYYQSCFSPQLKNAAVTDRGGLSTILNDKTIASASVDTGYQIRPASVVYLPMSIAMFVGRGLGLPVEGYVILGRMASAWFYFIMFYLGMRHLKSGKLVMAACSLAPICLFEVSNYNYDYWPIAFIAYSMAYLLGEYQNKERTIRVKDIIIIFVSFLIGCVAKPVYVPLLGLAAFLPKTKFKTDRFKKCYYGFFITMVCLAAVGFIILIFGGFLGDGDMRGGTEVSVPGQIQYITSHFKNYCLVIFNFLKEYLSFNSIKMDLVDTAYIPRKEWLGSFVLIWTVIVAFLDRNWEENKKINCLVKVFVLPLAFITVWCVATALYITFTPVGNYTVNGCSGRYLMPILFPLMIVLSRIRFLVVPQPSKIKHWIDAGAFGISMVFAGIMMTAFL